MAKYEKYAGYKDSGIEWLGEIPAIWKMGALRWKINIASGEGVSSLIISKEQDLANNIPIIGGNGIMGFSNKDNSSHAIAIGRVGALCGNVHLINFKSWISDNALKISKWLDFDENYLVYLLKSAKLNDLASTTAQPLITGEQIKSLKVVIPLINEQTQIANFLDHETVKIDTLITKQEKLIELLKEKRQAVISHAVTKGLNSNVALKDSGVEWLGDVPKHWKISHLKYIASIYGRIGFRGYTVDDIVDEGEGALVLSPSNIIGDRFSLEKRTYLSWKKYYESPEIMVNNNDILLVKTGSTFGKSTIILKKNEPMTINPQMALIKGVSIDPRFLTYLFNSNFIKGCIEVSNTGSGMPTMTQENINNFIILIPTLGEDKLIADFLDREVDQIELIIKKAESAIQLMQERRTALISSAVTGKIDVRQWQNPNKNNEAKTELGA